jgi:hypothetical protein
MAKLNRAFFPLLVILFGLGIFCGVKLSRWFGSSARTFNTVAILQQVKTLSELVTVQYVIEKVELLEVPSEHLIGQIIGSENRVLLLAHGTVKAGIDLAKIKPEDLQVSGKSITFNLPRAQITDAYLDEKLTKVIDRKTGLLAPPDKDLEQTVRQIAVDDIRRAARAGGILRDADERARTQLKTLLLQLGFEKVSFGGDIVSDAVPVNDGPSSTPIP